MNQQQIGLTILSREGGVNLVSCTLLTALVGTDTLRRPVRAALCGRPRVMCAETVPVRGRPRRAAVQAYHDQSTVGLGFVWNEFIPGGLLSALGRGDTAKVCFMK